jgi:methionine-rich copper-binding protein CopC
MLVPCACVAQSPSAPASTTAKSILVTSSPAAGAVLKNAPESLKLHFNPPARLNEVTVTGPQGSMPMMVEAVGEVGDYDLPLSGMSPGSYTVEWTAISGGKQYSGQFHFKVAA